MNDLTGYLDIKDAPDCAENDVCLIDVESYPVRAVLDILLRDKSSTKVKKNIIWASNAYRSYGENCSDTSQIISQVFFTGKKIVLQPRIDKDIEQQQERTRKKAEVFTPVWLCNVMNNYADEEWFGRKDVFNHENDDRTWTVNEEKIWFPEGMTWKKYVDSRRLEITCGEAPYLVSRYDAATGDFVLPLMRRIGILDRKMRVVSENAGSFEEWSKWAVRAFQSCYGYEWQGDSLLIARINLLMTFYDFYKDKWKTDPEPKFLKKIANVISWNIWQMDGLNDVVPFGKPYQGFHQTTLFDSFGRNENYQEPETAPCKIYAWRKENSMLFKKCKSRGKMSKKMFDFVIGNPPYQESQDATSDTPVYNYFMDEAYKLSDRVELITPARFLFDAGKTPKAWNRKMLDDPHLTVLKYVQDSSKVFPTTDIKGGIAVTYRDARKKLGPITAFSIFPELNGIIKKVVPTITSTSMDDCIFLQNKWNLDVLYADHPDYKEKIGSDGRERRLTTNIFSLDVFHDERQTGDVGILGLVNNKRLYKYVNSKYIDEKDSNINAYKVILPKSNGSGAIGEVLSTPLIGNPLIGNTQSFISFGSFDDRAKAEACLKYIKSKFARTMLGTLKVTQDNNKGAWVNVPVQDFTSSSDIDWSQTISDIDRQLYQKYNLTQAEISFIESHVQEMR